MSPEVHWSAWTVVIPLIGALAAVGGGRHVVAIVIAVCLATSAAVAGVVMAVATHGAYTHAVGGWEPPLGIALRADGVSALMLAAVAAIGTAVSVQALDQYRGDPAQRARFFPLCFFTWGALDALVLSADVFNMYVALELTTLAAIALLAASGGRAAAAAALRYLLFAMSGSLAYLTGVVVLYGAHATLDLALLAESLSSDPLTWTAFAFMAVGLTLKSALFPFHAWLPPAYTSAGAPAAVLLAAVVGKASIYVLVRVWTELFAPLGVAAPGQLLGALGAAGVIWGSIQAMRQQHLASLLAYSSVAQIGYIFLLFPLGTTAALHGGILLILSHATAKGAMFMAAGTIRGVVGHDDLSAMPGLARRLPLTFFALGIGGVSLMGLPPSGGFVGKWLLARSALEVGQWWWSIAAVVGGLLAAGYVSRLLRGAFLPGPAEAEQRVSPVWPEVVSLLLALLSIGLGFGAALPLSLLTRAP